MENPHELPTPRDQIERVYAFARDLAFGVARGWWTTQFDVSIDLNQETWHFDKLTMLEAATRGITKKWNHRYPPAALLQTFGYIELSTITKTATGIGYLLTEKALRLLEKPSAPPSVFISYKRDQSSPLALLVEARLRLAGNPNPFVDKLIVAGEGWRERLKGTIEQSKYFVCLVGKDTLQSEWVQKEIEWAAEAGCTLISIWHGCEMDETCPAALRERHAITVTGESAREYETAISELLNALGYATY